MYCFTSNAIINKETYIPIQGVMTVVCRSNKDSWDITIPQLEIGKSYDVDYVIIGRSWSKVCLSEFPEQLFGAGLFTYYINDEEIHIIWDYRALKRISNDACRETTLMICRDLSKDRAVQIKLKHNNLRIISRSDILNSLK